MIRPSRLFRAIGPVSTCVVAVWLLLLGSRFSLAAQEPAPLRIGSRMRLQTVDRPSAAPRVDSVSGYAHAPGRGQWLVGEVREQTADSLVLHVEGEDQPVRFAWANVSAAELGAGRHSNAATGALIGGGVGLGLVGLIAMGTDDDYFDDLGPKEAYYMMVMLPSVALGTLIGAVARTERWRPYTRPRAALPSAGNGRWVVAVTVQR